MVYYIQCKFYFHNRPNEDWTFLMDKDNNIPCQFNNIEEAESRLALLNNAVHTFSLGEYRKPEYKIISYTS